MIAADAKRRTNPKRRLYMHTRNLRRSGWTLERFDKAWEEQGGKCAICPKMLNMDVDINDARACVDHKHVLPPIPRGILCLTCNSMLGQAQDNPDLLRAGAVYLERF